MRIIGCDYHPGFQQIAYVDTETGELQEATAAPGGGGEVLPRTGGSGMKVRLGTEASGHARWFERLLTCFTISSQQSHRDNAFSRLVRLGGANSAQPSTTKPLPAPAQKNRLRRCV